jgi:FPC/CPF motif-containing protein YcgG
MKGNSFGGAVTHNHRCPQSSRGEAFLQEAEAAFRSMVLSAGFSCIGAKAAINDGAYGFGAYDEMASENATNELARDLVHFARSDVMAQSAYATFVAVFESPRTTDEIQFEELLWRQLRQLHRVDAMHFAWDARVASDPQDPEFSFSFAGHAFYVIGMHANSSRVARRFPWPALVFNPHEQFEKLRRDGKWRRMQSSIRQREVALQGSINPMLSNFGEESEARQYSGRIVDDQWQAPFPQAKGSEVERKGKCPFAH